MNTEKWNEKFGREIPLSYFYATKVLLLFSIWIFIIRFPLYYELLENPFLSIFLIYIPTVLLFLVAFIPSFISTIIGIFRYRSLMDASLRKKSFISLLSCLICLLPIEYLLEKSPLFHSESPRRIENIPSISFDKDTEIFRFNNTSYTIVKWLKEPAMSFSSGHTILAIYDENGRLQDEAILYESFFGVEPEFIESDTIRIIQTLNDLRDDSSINYYSNSDLNFTRSKFQLSVVFTTYKEEVVELLQENENYLEISREDLVYTGSGANQDSSYTLFEIGTDQIRVVRTDDLKTIWINDSIWKTISVD